MNDQAEVFRHQAEQCEGRSPLYVDLCRRLAEDPRVPALVGELTWDAPLRLLGGLRALVLSGRARWDDLDAALAQAELPRLAARPIQTNEVRRSWALLPCFLELARRTDADAFDLIELGPSAGFNLLWDRFCHQYEAGSYLGDDGWRRVRETLDEAGRDGALAFVWTDRPAADVHDFWGLWLQLWPGGAPVLVAHADFHGAWIEWLA